MSAKPKSHNFVAFFFKTVFAMKDRDILNQRFIIIYNQLVKEGIIVTHSRDPQKSISFFAKQLGTEPHIIKCYLKGSRKITYDQAKRLCRIYGIN